MKTRTDVYRPSVINVNDFEFVCLGYTGPNFGDLEYAISLKKILTDHMARTGGKFARIERSKEDPKFGFFSRPTKATVEVA